MLHKRSGTMCAGRNKYRSKFAAVTLGCHNAHFVGKDWHLEEAADEGCILLVEAATYLLQLTNEEVRK